MSTEDLISIGKGAGIAAAGAVLTYLSQWLTSTEFGVWTPLAVALLSVLANVLRKASTTPVADDPLSPDDVDVDLDLDK